MEQKKRRSRNKSKPKSPEVSDTKLKDLIESENDNRTQPIEFCHPLGPEVSKDKRFLLKIEVAGVPVSALVDSDAMRSYIGNEFFYTSEAHALPKADRKRYLGYSKTR